MITVIITYGECQLGLVGAATAYCEELGVRVKRVASKDKSNRSVVYLVDGQNTAGNLKP